MPINYFWKIEHLDVAPSLDGLENVVTNIHWRYEGVNEDGVHGSMYGSTSVPLNTEETYTAYDSLAEEQVLGWLVAILGETVNEYKTIIENQIQDNIAPKKLTLSPPWVTVSTPDTPL